MSFRFIDTEYTGSDATSADAMQAQALGYIFALQQKQIVFRIANTSSTQKNFRITASGQNATLVAAVDFSRDKTDWINEVSFSGIQPNAITDPIWCRFTPDDEFYLTSGTFLIQCSEVV